MPSDAIVDRQLAFAGAGAEEHVSLDGPFVHDPHERSTGAASALAAMTGRPRSDFVFDGAIPEFDPDQIEVPDDATE